MLVEMTKECPVLTSEVTDSNNVALLNHFWITINKKIGTDNKEAF